MKKANIHKKQSLSVGGSVIGGSARLNCRNTIPNLFYKQQNKTTKVSRKLALSFIVKPRFESTPCKSLGTASTSSPPDSDCEVLVDNITPIRSVSSLSSFQNDKPSLLINSPMTRKMLSLDETFLKSLDLEEIERNSCSNVGEGPCSSNSNLISAASGSNSNLINAASGSTSSGIVINDGNEEGVAKLICLTDEFSDNNKETFVVPVIPFKKVKEKKSLSQTSIITAAEVHCEDINIDWDNDSMIDMVLNSDNNNEDKDSGLNCNEKSPENRKRPSPQNNGTSNICGKKLKIMDDSTSKNPEKHTGDNFNRIRISTNLLPGGSKEFPNFPETSHRSKLPGGKNPAVQDSSGLEQNVKQMLSKDKTATSKLSKKSFEEKIKNILVTNLGKPVTIRSKQPESSVEPSTSSTFFGLPLSVKELIYKYKGISKLYGWQEECLKLKAVEERKNLIYALPTSGGKTLVAEILIFRELLCAHKNVLFILPYVSIVQEKVYSLSQFALDLGVLVEEYAAGKGRYPPRKRRHKQSVYIATMEKAHSLINSLIETNRLSEIGLVVVDELHLLGEEKRGAVLECLLTKILFCSETIHIVGMSATIGNLEELANFLQADVYCNDFRPVELKEYVKHEGTLWAVNYKEEEILSEARKINPQSNPTMRKIDPDGVCTLVLEIVPKHSCLVFCATKKGCENVASMLVSVMPSSLLEIRKHERKALLSALSYEMKGLVCPILRKCIPYGVVYHHAGLTGDERKLIEEAYRTGTLYCICCTSTLAAGVNLPAKRVILRSPYVGCDFITLSRYKQMAGRAGRAGFDNTGESIIVCKTRDEVQQVKNLLCSKMNTVDSKLDKSDGQALQSLVLSAIGLGIATTRRELHKLVSCSLLHIQSKRTEVNSSSLVDSVVKDLFASKFLRIQLQNSSHPSVNEVHLNCSENCPSNLSISVAHNEKRSDSSNGEKKKNALTRDTVMKISRLGTACIKGPIDLHRAHELYKDLRVAQNGFVLRTYLHLLYIVTPYDIVEMTKLLPEVYYQSYLDLDDGDRSTAEAIGITEGSMVLIMKGRKSSKIPDRVFRRFYVTLMLNDLWKNNTVWEVAQKYSVSRGSVQTLMTSASSFASCVLHFCEEMSEFWGFKELLSGFVQRLSHCCSAELLPLMDLPAVKLGRARQLYNAGFKTLKEIANADANSLAESVEHLPRRVASQIIAAAKLLLVQEAENLREAAEDVMEGLLTGN